MQPHPPVSCPVPDAFASADAFLAAFADRVGGLISYVDRDERIVFASRALAEWFGHTRESIAGLAMRDVHTPQSFEEVIPWIRRALAGEPCQYEREARHADGRSFWISVDLRPYRDASGEVIGVFTCALEVNELKRTHDALGRALEEIASHMENTPLAVVEFDAELRIKRWSPQARAIFGWSFEEARGRTAVELDFIHPDSLESVREQTRGLIDGRERRSRVLCRNLTSDGVAIWCEWYSSAFYDEAGRLASILALAQDVTARVESEEQLKQAAVHDALTGLPNRNSLAARL